MTIIRIFSTSFGVLEGEREGERGLCGGGKGWGEREVVGGEEEGGGEWQRKPWAPPALTICRIFSMSFSFWGGEREGERGERGGERG